MRGQRLGLRECGAERGCGVRRSKIIAIQSTFKIYNKTSTVHLAIRRPECCAVLETDRGEQAVEAAVTNDASGAGQPPFALTVLPFMEASLPIMESALIFMEAMLTSMADVVDDLR